MKPEKKTQPIDTLLDAGAALLNAGDFAESLSLFEQALAQNPKDILSTYNAGVASQHLGQLRQAIAYYRKTIQEAPDFVAALFNLATAYVQVNDAPEAVKAFKNVISKDPGYVQAYYNMGIAHERSGSFDKALAAYRQVICLDPEHAEALNNIGVIQRDRGNIDTAIHFFKKAIAINPNLIEAHYNVGVAHQKNGEYDKSIQSYQNALRIDPEYAPARWFSLLSLPMLYESSDDILKHRNRIMGNLEKLIQTTRLEIDRERQRALEGVGVFTNFFLQYQGQNDIEFQERYGRFVHRIMTASYPRWTKDKQMPMQGPVGKKRVGYVSSFMYGHTVGDYLLGWVENHSPQEFEIYCYQLGLQNDAITQRLRSKASVFHQISGGIESAAEIIEADRLNVLVYPDIGMVPMAMQLASLRLAPIQCVHFGHPVTTGLPTIDYFLTSDSMEPEGAEAHYTEKLVRLPNLSICFAPPELPATPKSRSAFGLSDDCFVLLSTQSLYKYLPQHDDIYPKIASEVHNAQFVFIDNPCAGANAFFKQRLFRAFHRHGLKGDRFCRFIPQMNHADFLSLNLCADVLLDTMEWSGCHTTLEALACGLPVVTLPGGLMRGRHSLAILLLMDLHDTIAQDKSDYICIATRLAHDHQFYNKIRCHIHNNKHRVFHDRTVVEKLEDFYRSVVEHPEGSQTVRPGLQKTAMTGSADLNASDEEKQYLRVLELEPDNMNAAFALGSLCLRRNNGVQALTWLQKVLERMPDSAAVHNNVGKAFLLQGDERRARLSFDRACKLDPELAEAWFNLAELDQHGGFMERAIAHYRNATRINPRMNAAYNNMGNALRRSKRYPEAIAAFQKVIALEPDLAQGHYNLGSALRLNQQYQEAIVHLSKAIQLIPGYADAWNNLGLTCKNMGDLNRALSYFNKAIQLQSDFAVARWNRSFVHFLKGNWTQGWLDFEWRFKIPHWRTIYPHRISGKRWDGQPIGDQTLLVHDEQGLGDTFQFVRYLPWAKARCGRLILETRRELLPLIENCPGIDDIVIRSNQGPPALPYDQYAPLMSLGRIINADPRHMAPMAAYIKAPQVKILQWKHRMPSDRINIGLVWAGRPEHGNDANRSCKLKLFTPLFHLPGFQFIGLQKGPATAQAEEVSGFKTFSNWGNDLENFADTAGIIHHLDLVLTVDTSVAHLAGAMGRPVWVLIPYLPDWRWGINGELTSWYPSMRLFRQIRPGDWQTVIGRVQSELERMAGVDALRAGSKPIETLNMA